MYRKSSKSKNHKPIPDPCPSCVAAYEKGLIRAEAIQPLPEGCPPLNYQNELWCHDCASAGTVARFTSAVDWEMARTAVGNDRQEALRCPQMAMGLVRVGFVRPSRVGDMDKHHAWLAKFGYEPHEEKTFDY